MRGIISMERSVIGRAGAGVASGVIISDWNHPQIVNPKLLFGRIGSGFRKRSLEFRGVQNGLGNAGFQSQFCRIRRMSVNCKAMEQSQSQIQSASSNTVYQGVYGPWTIEPSDVREVILYRAGLVTAAASFVVAGSTAFLPADSFLKQTLEQSLDVFYLLGTAGLGLSLYFIHIYVTAIKRTLQALWALGVVGSLATYIALAQPAGQGLVQYVLDNPTAVWFVGPLFAALTGLVFKEGLCYGKLEAGVLTFIIPTILLGHLTGLMDDGVKSSLLGLWMALFIVFAGRKFTQPMKDDIGDKSVFMFNALSDEEKAALLEKQKS
uniref:Integral membrane protein n=1 Tax=Opuntia streptacantha TaxID=393608 RepID=A0A7C9CW03_OPUST